VEKREKPEVFFRSFFVLFFYMCCVEREEREKSISRDKLYTSIYR
jgi:hypothetical protein